MRKEVRYNMSEWLADKVALGLALITQEVSLPRQWIYTIIIGHQMIHTSNPCYSSRLIPEFRTTPAAKRLGHRPKNLEFSWSTWSL
jgi:hypothetical protein